MVKLAFLPYGHDVHEALHAAGFAPKYLGRSDKPEIGASVIIMEYLTPPSTSEPGWVTLFDLFQKDPALVRKKKELINIQLCALLDILKCFNFVHGDLRSNNLMIYCTLDTIMEPVRVNAVDMEWSGKLGTACYPEDRNPLVGYPGTAAGCIGPGDDAKMIEHWWNEVCNA